MFRLTSTRIKSTHACRLDPSFGLTVRLYVGGYCCLYPPCPRPDEGGDGERLSFRSVEARETSGPVSPPRSSCRSDGRTVCRPEMLISCGARAV
jgi:hypothetical protein